MRYLLVMVVLLFTLSTKAQTEKARDRFTKQLFKDFQRNHLDKIVDMFVDSVYLDELITKSIEKGEKVSKDFTREKIHNERLKAKERFSKTLRKAYEKFTKDDIQDGIKRVIPEVKIYRESKKPFYTFGVKYSFELDDSEAELTFPRIIYDSLNREFVMMNDRVRSHYFQGELKVAETTEVREYEHDDIAQDVIAEPSVKMPRERVSVIPAAEEQIPKPPVGNVEIEHEETVVIDSRKERQYSDELTEREVMDIQEPVQVIPQEQTFQFVESMPEFPGGPKAMNAFIAKNIKYPPIARDAGIEGTVYIRFVVSKEGNVQKAKIVRDIGGNCGKEALRVIRKMPKWKPGMQRGKPVNVSFNIPVRFKLK